MFSTRALKRLGLAGLLAGLGLSTAACTDGYGYSGVGVGVAGAYGDPYYDGYGGGFGGDPYYAGGLGYGGYGLGGYYGWYGDYYYPGTGVYVYDRNRRPYRWNDGQRRYWEGRRGGYGNGRIRDNWADFRRDYRNERRDDRGDLSDNRQAYRSGAIDRDQSQQGRQDARREFRRDVRQDDRETRQENRAVRGTAGDAVPRAGGWNGGSGARAGGWRGGGGARTGGFRGGGRRGGR